MAKPGVYFIGAGFLNFSFALLGGTKLVAITAKNHRVLGSLLCVRVASANEEAARNIPEKLAKIISDGRILRSIKSSMPMKQDCFWKKMPIRTTLQSRKNCQWFKAAKDRVTLLLCSNASGDRMLKPAASKSIFKNHRALKGKRLKYTARTLDG
ncbi:hypothetical protein TNCV_2707211 [Trichonephila clavipes]|nr:hypothetical protein TNCV_2707211 [Trichonephila clavipes]